MFLIKFCESRATYALARERFFFSVGAAVFGLPGPTGCCRLKRRGQPKKTDVSRDKSLPVTHPAAPQQTFYLNKPLAVTWVPLTDPSFIMSGLPVPYNVDPPGSR